MNTPTASARGARHRQHGVTLIEACVVLALTAIAATTAAPGLQDLIDTRRLEGAATQLATDLQFIRTEAMARNLPLRHGEAREIKTVTVAGIDHVALQGNVGSMLFDPLHGTASPTGTLRLLGTQGRAVHHAINLMGRVRSCSPQALARGYRAC